MQAFNSTQMFLEKAEHASSDMQKKLYLAQAKRRMLEVPESVREVFAELISAMEASL